MLEAYVIRAATKGDLDAVYELMRQLSRHHFTKEQFESCYLYNLENNRILVCEENKYVRGCGVLNIHYPLHFSRKSAEIVNLVVDATSRSRGIGKKLLASLEQTAASQGCACIEVDSGKHRDGAHRFYCREGFVNDHYKFSKEL